MNPDVEKLLRYIIDSDGTLDPSYARAVFSRGLNAEYFAEYRQGANEFRDNAYCTLFDFALDYWDKHQLPTPEDVITNELLTRSDLVYTAKKEITDRMRTIRRNDVNPNEFPYALNRVCDDYLTKKSISIIQSGLHAVKVDPQRGIASVQQGLANLLSSTMADDENIENRPLMLSQFAKYLRSEIVQHGQLLHNSIPYPYASFNRNLGGMLPGEFIVIAGTAGTGKSFIARDIAYNAALDRKLLTVCADREMQHSQQGVRFLARLTGIPQRKLRDADALTKAERALLEAALVQFETISSELDDTMLMLPPNTCTNADNIKSYVESMLGRRKPRLLIADYLNEFDPVKRREGWEGVKQVCTDLKRLGQYFQCPVITLAQTDGAGKIQYKAIRHVCDTLMILTPNPEFPYVPPNEDEYVGTPGIIDVYVDKSRNEAGGIGMKLEVEFATASIRQAGKMDAKSIVSTAFHARSPYAHPDDDDDHTVD